MSDFPKPPVMSQSSMPPAPAPEKRSGLLTDDESSFILDAELSKARRNESSILAFIDSFTRCKNIRQASFEAGVSYEVGYRYRHYVDVSAAITKIIDRSAVKYGFDASELMERNKEIVDFDPIMVYNRDGSFISNMYDIPAEARRNIKKLKVKNIWSETEDINGVKSKLIVGEIIEYEFYDKQKAIEMGGKEKDLFKNTTKIVHDVTDNMASILLASASKGKEAVKKIVEAEYTESKDAE